jgi:cysteine desulfurase
MIVPIYLDNSATTKVRSEVVEAMIPYLASEWGNPSSLHRFGRQSAQALVEARSRVSRLLNCDPEEIFFSPCGTYSNNTAIVGRARFAEANDLGKHMITCSIEHPAVLGPAKHLEALGWRITYLPVDSEGLVSPADLSKALQSDTSIISIMWANNEIGTIQPIDQLAGIAEESGIYFHTDAVQVPGKLPIDVSQVKVSSLSISGHKFHAPKGVGVLYVRKNVNLMPLVYGGGQERGLFPGTEALASIVGIGRAAELAREELTDNLSSLRSKQAQLMKRLLAVDGVRMTGPVEIERRLPGHVSVVVPGCDGEALVLKADLKGVCISSGSACHKGIKEPSQILTATGIPAGDAIASARISIGRFNTDKECDQAADLLAGVFQSSRQGGSRALSKS